MICSHLIVAHPFIFRWQFDFQLHNRLSGTYPSLLQANLFRQPSLGGLEQPRIGMSVTGSLTGLLTAHLLYYCSLCSPPRSLLSTFFGCSIFKLFQTIVQLHPFSAQTLSAANRRSHVEEINRVRLRSVRHRAGRVFSKIHP